MVGTDRLTGDTVTPPVSQRSESGQGILGVKTGTGILLWSAVVVSVLSSRMSAGGGQPRAGGSFSFSHDGRKYFVNFFNIFRRCPGASIQDTNWFHKFEEEKDQHKGAQSRLGSMKTDD